MATTLIGCRYAVVGAINGNGLCELLPTCVVGIGIGAGEAAAAGKAFAGELPDANIAISRTVINIVKPRASWKIT